MLLILGLLMSADAATDAAAEEDAPATPSVVAASDLPDLPEELTSFGATRLGQTVYVYGGNTGSAHGYDREGQSRTLWTLDLDAADRGWTAAGEGQHLQGNALVAAGGRVVLLGGFKANNAPGEEQDLESLATVRAWDPAAGQWSDLPPLPEPRSSFDAVADGRTIYVVGGWKLTGDAETDWHRTAWSLDLTADSPAWQALPEPPFQRRALVAAMHNGRLYAIGGMTPEGPTVRVDVFDPAAGAWSRGPDLPGDGMNGFGGGAAVLGGQLVVTTFTGEVVRLNGDAWTVAGRAEPSRFFHRLVGDGDRSALVIGGVNHDVGKFARVDRLTLPE